VQVIAGSLLHGKDTVDAAFESERDQL